MIVTFFLRRANEENNKLKTRYEQAKEEIENLVSKLNTYLCYRKCAQTLKRGGCLREKLWNSTFF